MTHSASLLLLGFLARPVRVHEFVELVHQALLGGTTGPIRGFLEQDDILKSRPCPLIPRVYMIMKQLMNEAVDELVNQAVNEAFNTAPQLSAVSKPLTTPTSDRPFRATCARRIEPPQVERIDVRPRRTHACTTGANRLWCHNQKRKKEKCTKSEAVASSRSRMKRTV